jgi:hypothetical protein
MQSMRTFLVTWQTLIRCEQLGLPPPELPPRKALYILSASFATLFAPSSWRNPFVHRFIKGTLVPGAAYLTLNDNAYSIYRKLIEEPFFQQL